MDPKDFSFKTRMHKLYIKIMIKNHFIFFTTAKIHDSYRKMTMKSYFSIRIQVCTCIGNTNSAFHSNNSVIKRLCNVILPVK